MIFTKGDVPNGKRGNPNLYKHGKPFSKENQPTDEQRAEGMRKRKENAERRKTYREMFEILLAEKYKDKKGNELSGVEITAQALFKKAVEGDLKAFELLRDTVGEKPIEKVAVSEIDQSELDEVENIVNEAIKKRNSSVSS